MAIAADDDASAVELEQMQITATREPEPADRVPASITIVTGAELRARGANDLRTALSLVAGVEGTPGGDGGPGGSVPALWGLREVDAFLLVVDGVPWGGAFNPQTAQVDLNNVERIEVLRGAAPVMYGATSFNGVIHIIHYAAGESPTLISAGGGSYGSVFGTGTTSLPAIGGFKQSIAATIEKRGFSVDREDFQRYHLLYRGGADLGFGRFRLDGDVTVLPQAPDNVTFRNGANLRTDLFSADVNHNPSDAKLDQDRFHLVAGLDVDAGIGEWGTTLSFTRTFDDIIRGFLRDYAPETGAEAGDEEKPDDFDADGYSQKRQFTDIYFDTHLTTKLGDAVTWTTGVDYLYGKGKQNAVNFGYFVSLDGEDAPAGSDQHADELVRSENERNFAGLYTQVDWRVLPSVDVLAGVRLNHTREETVGQETLNDEDQNDVQPENSDERTKTRVSGVVGATWTAFREGGNHLAVYADYRNTYKPLAVDFGPEAEVDILQPETSSSYEAGIKGAALDGRYEYNASVFQLDFRNLKTPDENGNNVNAGKTKFKGAEIEVRYTVIDNLKLAGSYSVPRLTLRGVPPRAGAEQHRQRQPLRAFALSPGRGRPALHAAAGLQRDVRRQLHRRAQAEQVQQPVQGRLHDDRRRHRLQLWPRRPARERLQPDGSSRCDRRERAVGRDLRRVELLPAAVAADHRQRVGGAVVLVTRIGPSGDDLKAPSASGGAVPGATRPRRTYPRDAALGTFDSCTILSASSSACS